MQYNDLVGHVQNRARLASSDEAVRAIHATFETLGERLAGGEADNLAAQLPEEIGDYLRHAERDAAFSPDAFFQRVAKREDVSLPAATHHARAVIAVLGEAVSAGALANARAQLGAEYDPLFESGSEGEM